MQTRECHKLRPMSGSTPFTTQSNADALKCFKWRKRGGNNILVSDFRKMFARQISKVHLHWQRLQSKVHKNFKVDAKC